MGGIWFSDTRHLDPKVPEGEGRVLAMRYQSPEPEGNRKRENAGGGSSPHQEGRGGYWFLCYQAPGPEGDRKGDTAGGVAGEHEVFVEEIGLACTYSFCSVVKKFTLRPLAKN